MKKSILFSIILGLILILGFTTGVNAYSSADYSIDVPASFTETTENVFSSTNGSSFNVQITSYDLNSDGYPYTNANLEAYATALENSGVKVSSKEITTFTKNNYKCLKVDAKVYSAPCRQYVVISGSKAFILTLASASDAGMNSADMNQIISSFTINNYQEPSASGVSTTPTTPSSGNTSIVNSNGNTSIGNSNGNTSYGNTSIGNSYGNTSYGNTSIGNSYGNTTNSGLTNNDDDDDNNNNNNNSYKYGNSEFSNDKCSMSFPGSFTQVEQNRFAKSDSSNIHIAVTEYSEKDDGYPFSQENLDKYSQEVARAVNGSVLKKEITNVTNNKYKCLHVIAKGDDLYCDQYAIISGNDAFIISLSGEDERLSADSDMQTALNSFTIKDYKAPQEPFPMWMIFAIGGGVLVVVVIIIVVANKNKSNKGNNNSNMNNSNMYNQNMNNQNMNNQNMFNQNVNNPNMYGPNINNQNQFGVANNQQPANQNPFGPANNQQPANQNPFGPANNNQGTNNQNPFGPMNN